MNETCTNTVRKKYGNAQKGHDGSNIERTAPATSRDRNEQQTRRKRRETAQQNYKRRHVHEKRKLLGGKESRQKGERESNGQKRTSTHGEKKRRGIA